MVTTFWSWQKTMSTNKLDHHIHHTYQRGHSSLEKKNSTYMSPVKTLHNQLMSSSNQLQVVGMVELLRYVLQKCDDRWGRHKSMKKSQLYKKKADNKTGWVSVTWPKVYPAPRGEIPQPHRSSGSDHKRSHMGPSWGTSWTRSKFRMLSRVSMDGDSPPCRQNISDSTLIHRTYQLFNLYMYTKIDWSFIQWKITSYFKMTDEITNWKNITH